MNKMTLIAAAPLAMMASAAIAGPTDTQDFTISATIQPECSLEDPQDVNFGTLAINEDAGEDALQGTFGRRNNTQNIWVSCNYGADMSISSGPMVHTTEVNDGPDAADFTDEIDLRWGLEASDGTAFRKMFFDTKTKSGDNKTNADAFHDDAILSVNVNDQDLGDLRPLAGDYQAVATINLGAI